MITEATIQCPACGFKKREEMPPSFSEMEYTCPNCQKKLTASEKECCIYCKYSEAICPAQQNKRNCCGG